MALIFCDGFDWYRSADILKRWTALPGASLETGAQYSRGGGQGLWVTGAAGGASPCTIYKSLGANYSQGVIGFAFRWGNSTVLASRNIMLVLDGVTEQISIRTNASSVLYVSRSGASLATGTTPLSLDTWYYIELKFTINGSSGSVELNLNGATEIASTGSLDTTSTANDRWTGLGFLSLTSAVNMWIDDVYALDSGSGTNTNFLGPVQVVSRAPSANGATVAWTPNGGSNVGSVGEDFQDGTATFNQSATANQVDTFEMQNAPIASGSLFAVAHHLVAVQDAGATRTIAPVLRLSGTDYVGTGVALSTSIRFLSEYYDQNPATSSAWALSEWNGAESGYKLVS
jgi:hypothetical protein